jgi:hypothetical protein
MIRFILNIPYTFFGLLVGLISIPESFKWRVNPYVMIIKIKRFWWTVGYMKHARAMTIGHVILLSPKIIEKDLEHEIVHVRQHERTPIIQPILYLIELLRKGYRNNRYEVEAYQISGSKYEEN